MVQIKIHHSMNHSANENMSNIEIFLSNRIKNEIKDELKVKLELGLLERTELLALWQGHKFKICKANIKVQLTEICNGDIFRTGSVDPVRDKRHLDIPSKGKN